MIMSIGLYVLAILKKVIAISISRKCVPVFSIFVKGAYVNAFLLHTLFPLLRSCITGVLRLTNFYREVHHNRAYRQTIHVISIT